MVVNSDWRNLIEGCAVMEGCGLVILFDGEINESGTSNNDWKATLEAEVFEETRLCLATKGCDSCE